MAVDTTVPTVSTPQSGWYTTATNTTITTSADNISGIAWTQYSWDTNNACTAGTAYSGPISIPTGAGGLHTLYMCAPTIAGQQSGSTTSLGTASATIAIDTTVPTLSSTPHAGWYTIPTDATITAADAVSGIAWIQYSWDTNDACAMGAPYTTPICDPGRKRRPPYSLHVRPERRRSANHGERQPRCRHDWTDGRARPNRVGMRLARPRRLSGTDDVSGIAWTQYSSNNNNACNAGTPYSGPIPIESG